ncbi:MAG: patatin-like phospholipase family protein [Myxococcales bacterium]|nr:patatin-like phospholipase family protein [Myxococcales bacterium]
MIADSRSDARALVLSGGGVRGAYQVGVLRYWLGEERTRYGLLAGTSVGALNAAFLAQYPLGEETRAIADLEALWRSLRPNMIARRWFPFGRLHGFWRPAIFDSRPLQRLIGRTIDAERIRRSGRRLVVGAVSLESGLYRTFDESDPNIVAAVAASSAFPGYFLPIEIDGERYTDGGVREETPVAAVIQAGAPIVDVVMTAPGGVSAPLERRPNAIAVARQAIDAMLEEVIDTDIAVAELFERLRGLEDPTHPPAELRLVRPKSPVRDDVLTFEPATVDRLIRVGYLDVCRVCRAFDSPESERSLQNPADDGSI